MDELERLVTRYPKLGGPADNLLDLAEVRELRMPLPDGTRLYITQLLSYVWDWGAGERVLVEIETWRQRGHFERTRVGMVHDVCNNWDWEAIGLRRWLRLGDEYLEVERTIVIHGRKLMEWARGMRRRAAYEDLLVPAVQP